MKLTLIRQMAKDFPESTVSDWIMLLSSQLRPGYALLPVASRSSLSSKCIAVHFTDQFGPTCHALGYVEEV